MKKFAAIAATVLLTAACGAPSGDREAAPVTVETMQVVESDVAIWAHGYTRLEGMNQAGVYGTGGTVEEILVTPGDTVEAGDLLMILSTDTENSSNAASAAAGVSSAGASLAMAKDALDRVSVLHSAGGASDQELLNAQLSVESARAALSSAQASYAGTFSRSSNSLVTAPFSGAVGRLNVGVGEPSSATQPLLTVASAGLLKAEVLLPEDAVGRIETGDHASVMVSAGNGTSYSATVTSVAPFIDPATGLLSAEVSVSNPDGSLVPGMAAEVSVRLDVHSSVVAVPELSLISSTSGYQVAVEEDGIARLREAQIGYRENGFAEIVSGLEPGESLIVAGQQLVSDGSPVTPAPAEEV